MIEVRFHGRGGQGVKIASRILGRSGFLARMYAQDFAIFGAERRGAPVVSCTRLDEQPIEIRGYVEQPDLVVVMDPSLLKEAPEQVFHGVDATTPLLVNGSPGVVELAGAGSAAANFTFIDLTTLCRRLIGHPFVSAAAAALAARSVGAISLDTLLAAAQLECAESGMAQDLITHNQTAAREAYGVAPASLPRARRAEQEAIVPSFESIPCLNTARFIAPVIRRRGSAALRHTGSWRMERPEIELAQCKRCFLCYLYCPEAAIMLDAENYPHVDYDHCKGCMTCVVECPTKAVARGLEH